MKHIKLKACLLYLRGFAHIACNYPIEGLRDFHALYATAPGLFPREFTAEIISSLDPNIMAVLQKESFYKQTGLSITFFLNTSLFSPYQHMVFTWSNVWSLHSKPVWTVARQNYWSLLIFWRLKFLVLRTFLNSPNIFYLNRFVNHSPESSLFEHMSVWISFFSVEKNDF